MSDDNVGILLAQDAPFPDEWQGSWIDEDGIVSIFGREVLYFGQVIKFDDMIAHYEDDGQIGCIEISCDEDDWGRDNPQFFALINNHADLLIANSRGDSTLKRSAS